MFYLELLPKSIKKTIKKLVPKTIQKKIRFKYYRSKNWEDGVKEEIRFWENYLKDNPNDWRLNPNLFLQHEIVNLLHVSPILNHDSVSILDVGAGPLTTLGKVCFDFHFKITPVDVLAEDYDNILSRLKIVPLIRTIKGRVEDLDIIFGLNTFELVYMQNALDHCEDPIAGLKAMINVIKEECYIFLQHFINVAENEDYSGLHKWNLCAENNQFIIWNNTSKYNINDIFKRSVNITMLEEDGWLAVKLKKCR
jgi:SAM-dependent methyltransferase